MRNILFQLNNLCFSYCHQATEKQVLNSINKEIRAGEYLALIGGNGSGKTTLAKHLNGLLLPTEGSVVVNGMDTGNENNLLAVRQTVGMVFQNPDNQIVASVVEEDVAFGPENLGLELSEIRHRVTMALDIVGLTSYRRSSPDFLSGGEKQRLALAGVLAMKPQCLVLDEATSMLDQAGRYKLMKIIANLNKESGVTVIQITHDMNEAALSDRIWVLSEGRVILDGPPREVFQHRNILDECGLDLPDIAEISWKLRDAGIAVPLNLLKLEDLVEYLCQL